LANCENPCDDFIMEQGDAPKHRKRLSSPRQTQ
jgi:hypothetical protein